MSHFELTGEIRAQESSRPDPRKHKEIYVATRTGSRPNLLYLDMPELGERPCFPSMVIWINMSPYNTMTCWKRTIGNLLLANLAKVNLIIIGACHGSCAMLKSCLPYLKKVAPV